MDTPFGLALFRSLCNKRQLSRKNKFDKLSGMFPALVFVAGKIKTYTGTSAPLFSKKATPWGKKWPVQMNLPFFAVKAYVPGGGVQKQAEKKFEKCLPAGTGTKIYFSSVAF